MKEGTVKFFNETKGFGFIKDAESDNEYFVHISGLIDKVKNDDQVTFELKEGRKGMNAVNVKTTIISSDLLLLALKVLRLIKLHRPGEAFLLP